MSEIVLAPSADTLKSRDSLMRIGEFTKQTKVTSRTVRYYESLGLILHGERKEAGQHRYPEQSRLLASVSASPVSSWCRGRFRRGSQRSATLRSSAA